MTANSFGQLFRITSFGESHGVGVGVVVDGCPPRLALTEEDINVELRRRRPGQSRLTTQREETDECEILSGVENGFTLGSPIAILVRNNDARPEDYNEMRKAFRPSHADFTYYEKYGVAPSSGGGRASARETIARVAGGAVARKVLALFGEIDITAYVLSVEKIHAEIDALGVVTRDEVDATEIRCPDKKAAVKMIQSVENARRDGDSLGGVIECVVRGVPAGWGDPVFNKLDATLALGLMSLPAAKGFEIGSGFAGTTMRGSSHNDPFVVKGARIGTSSNFSGGIQGGISNGEDIVLRIAFKPTATIAREQQTVDVEGESVVIQGKGRHDPCVLPRAVPIVEAMVALTLADHALRHRGICG